MNNDFYKQDKKQEKLFFNQFPLNNYDVFTEKTYERLLNLFKKEIIFRDNLKILDLGCGSGAFTKYLLKLNGQIFGLDISMELIKKGDKQIHYVVGDIEKLPFIDNTFDVVIFSAVLHHFPCLKGPVREVYRILKKNGKCFAFDPNNRNPIMWIFRNRKSPFYYSKGITTNERLLTNKEIETVFQTYGFKVNTFAISGISYKYVHNKIIRFFLPLYNFLDNVFAKMHFSYRYGSFLLTFAQK